MKANTNTATDKLPVVRKGREWLAELPAADVAGDIALWTWGRDPEHAMQLACDKILPDGGRGWLITLAPLTDDSARCVWTISLA